MIRIGFIGLGLIGGSIAKALKRNRADVHITVFDPDRDSLNLARADGVADVCAGGIDASFSQVEVLFFCAPVSANGENLRAALPFLSPDCVLTDVGSVKTPIFSLTESLGLSRRFIGGHPMAGSERTGYASSKASLLESAYYIVAPAPGVPEETAEHFRALVASTGAIPLRMESGLHDYVTAAVSHLPHIAAASLVNLVRDKDTPEGWMRVIAAGGFRDITRIASSSPVMWQQICMTNTVNILEMLDAYLETLGKARSLLAKRDAEGIRQFFEDARTFRDSFPEAGAGPIKKSYLLRVDIADQAGALAAVAGLLADAEISIKNIGISHNREREEGVLHMEFYDPEALERAMALLSGHGYSCHPREGEER